MSAKEIVDFVINEVLFNIVEEKTDYLGDEDITERSDSMYSYPESSKDDQVIPGYENHYQSNQGLKSEIWRIVTFRIHSVAYKKRKGT